MRSRIGIICLAVALLAGPEAEARRFALLIGANHGRPGEQELRFAVNDARRMAEVLRDWGGFPAENIVLLEDPTAAQVLSAQNSLDARMRQAGAELFVTYYSGHGGHEAVHLAGEGITWTELRQRSERANALARLLIVDACRSGQATGVKGGLAVELPDFLKMEEQPAPEGFAAFSSAAAGEPAQESRKLEGSLFTHHLISALLGAADLDGSGSVDAVEAFDYAARRTLSDSVAHFGTLQHATYDYGIRGRDALILTDLAVGQNAAIRLTLPGVYLVSTKSLDGPVVAEAQVGDKGPVTVRLRPGRYAMRRRMPRLYGQTQFAAEPGQVVEAEALAWQAEAPIASDIKGTAPRRRSIAGNVSALGTVTYPPLPGFSVAPGGVAGVAFDLPHSAVDIRVGYGFSSFGEEPLPRSLHVVDIDVGARAVFDLRHAVASVGGTAGLSVLIQRHETTDRSSLDRVAVAPRFTVGTRMDVPVGGRFFVLLDLWGLLRRIETIDDSVNQVPEVNWRPGLQAGLGVGRYW